MVNNFRAGSLVTASNSSISDSHSLESNLGPEHKFVPRIGNHTMFATVDGTIGSVIGLDARTTAFFSALQRAMNKVLCPIGHLKHEEFRSYRGQRNSYASRGFIDGDLIESFSDLDSSKMSLIVNEMNNEGKWYITGLTSVAEDARIDDSQTSNDKRRVLTVPQVLSMVEDMSLSH
jgi:DNA damage-binding protein 1